MSVIEASSGTYRSRVDGTIVLSVEIEPRYREAALKLFGMPGTSMALAALKDGHAAKSDKPAEPPVKAKADKPGELCRWVAIRCGEKQFRQWIEYAAFHQHVSEDDAAAWVRQTCGVESRAEIDVRPEAAALLREKVIHPYAAWLKTQALSAA